MRMVHRQFDVYLGDGCVGGQLASVRLRVEPGRSPYRYRTARLARCHGHGGDVFLRARPYIVTAQPSTKPWLEDGSDNGAPRRTEIGVVRAWYEAEERLLVLWECSLFPWLRATECRSDRLLIMFWTGCERELSRCLPGVERILTPSRQPSYPDDAWQAFLRDRGFQLPLGGAMAKALGKSEALWKEEHS